MPQLVVSDEGEIILLARCLKPALVDQLDFKIHLFTNDYTPLKNWLVGDLIELGLPGYLPVTLTAADWSDPTTVLDAAQSQWGGIGVTFSVTSGTAMVYGYYVTNNSGARGVWAQRFDSPQLIGAVVPLVFLPTLRGESQSEPT